MTLSILSPARPLLLSACALLLPAAALLGGGCGTNDSTIDAGTAQTDQRAASPCDVNNGGCSVSPMVTCGQTAGGDVVCGTCPTGYTGDGVVCVEQGCVGPADCDDGVACTVDTCGTSGRCLHAPSAALCSTGAVCHPIAGCMTGTICGSSADCVDSDPCTRDEVCSAATATCSFTLLDNDEDGEIPLVCGGTDCNDAAWSVGAGAEERCGNGRDDDCDGVIDTDATIASDPGTLLNDEENCGTCGNACGQGQSCYRGQCEPCGGSVGAPCCNTFCSSLSSCSGGTCNNGGVCVISGASATCAASCGARGEPCCAGSVCDLGSVCASGVCAIPGMVQCNDAGEAVSYRLGTLHIPTPSEANSGSAAGHNVDGRGDVCGVPDYANGTDNSLVDLAAALPVLSPADPIELQAEIDNALNCPVTGPGCTRLDLIVQVRTGTGCLVLEVLDGTGLDAATLAGPFAATLDGAGNFNGQDPSLVLPIPVATPSGVVEIELGIRGVRITGTLTSNALSNVVLGGYLIQQDFEHTIMDFLPLLGDDITFDDIGPILANLYDVQVGGSACTGLSVGFLGGGPRL